MANTTIKRCAIYTRKSSEEGLEQDYNSLHAQREACEAFIRSQAGEGWRLIKTAYDDGGFSGGSMERPALQQLLANIREGLIDVVVVYKVDRLTRSLADFARIVEQFDVQGVSFVAVTQQFNTTTSMGRLTLNVLLSFAQFEREVIGERIRDKVAASKRKGIWMGGSLPMGYDVRERKLIVNRDEAKLVKCMFERYVELGSVRLLKRELDAQDMVSAVKASSKGNRRGGKPFSRGALYCLLSNRIYLGEIRHKQEWHFGQHEPIVDRELWDRVQKLLGGRAARRGEGRKTEAQRSPLTGKLFDERGEPLYVQGAAKGERRYRYYVSRKLVRGGSEEATDGWRLSAPELERAVLAATEAMLSDHDAVAEACEASGIAANRLPSVLKCAQRQIVSIRDVGRAGLALAELVERVELCSNGIRVAVKLPIEENDNRQIAASCDLTLSKFVQMQLKRRGIETRIVLQGDSQPNRVDLPLLKAVARARRWTNDLISGRVNSIGDLARREGMDGRAVRRLIRLGFLTPRIVEAIAEGRQSPDLSVIGLTRRTDLPLLWNAQEQVLRSR